jgi:hypothetical protein
MHLAILDDLANLILVGAYWVKDILWLRLLSIVSSLVVIPYFLLQEHPLWTPTIWTVVFIAIHGVRCWQLVKERRPVVFTEDEQLLYDKTFSTLSPQQFKRVLAIGEWQDLQVAHMLHSTGDPPGSLEALVRGEVEVRRGGRMLARLGPGDLSGLASMLSGTAELFDQKVTKPALVMRWTSTDLRTFAATDEHVAASLDKIARAAMTEKLIRLVHADD